ncbi:hypothetical protein FGA82_10190 [Pseudomonas fluorescens]|nr:hypothetical protein FGA82_10190 [Pseudomonas fluorescens]
MGAAQEKPHALNAKRPPQWEAVLICGVCIREQIRSNIGSLLCRRSPVGASLLAKKSTRSGVRYASRAHSPATVRNRDTTPPSPPT